MVALRTSENSSTRLLRFGAPAVCLFSLGLAACSSAPEEEMLGTSSQAVVGSWSGVIPFPVIPIHAHLLTNNKLLFWSRHTHDAPPEQQLDETRPWLWDIATGAFTEAGHPGLEVFCSGHSLLADGRLFVAGGHLDHDGNGLSTSFAYNPTTNTWTQTAQMNAGRWYPTNTTLGDGNVLTVSGSINGDIGYNMMPQVYQVATNTWRDLSNATRHQPLYPMMHVVWNGLVFNSGPNADSSFVNTSGVGALAAGPESSHNREYGNAVMYDAGKLALIGGNTHEATSSVELIDLNAPAPSWREGASMAFPRVQQNATILPDGKVLVTGGSSAPGFNEFSGAVREAELWDPETDTWTTLAPQANDRLYHSVSVLLPDGRVVSGGGGLPPGDNGGENHPDIEIFSPPYLFQGTRPVIQSAPGRATWGQTISVRTSSPSSIRKVNLIRATSVTHSTNMDQRLTKLPFTVTSTGVSARIPGNPNVAPPGPYMLFVVNQNGVPSVASTIMIGHADPVTFCQQSGMNVIIGTSNNDNLTGTAGADCIVGQGGQDTINGQAGNDIIFGGTGNDNVNAGSGNDVVFGGTGQDIVTAGLGDDVCSGEDGDDQLSGGDGADTLLGGSGQDRLFGEAGNDPLIYGDTGDDQLFGGDGNDLITDCYNRNRVEGGNGSDQCQSDPADSTAIVGCEVMHTNFCG
jgi:hypothetical protein